MFKFHVKVKTERAVAVGSSALLPVLIDDSRFLMLSASESLC